MSKATIDLHSRPISTAEDRTLQVPPGCLVKTAWVPCHRVRLESTDRMGVGAVERAFHRRLQHRPDQRWPPPVGRWEQGSDGARTFVITAGRHEYVSALMIGDREVLVAWLDEA